TGLRDLDLTLCPVTDAGLRHLACLGRLRRLCLSRCGRLRGAGLQHLDGVEELDLSGCEGLEERALLHHLPRLTSLRKLSLGRCRALTEPGLAALRGLMPRCEVAAR